MPYGQAVVQPRQAVEPAAALGLAPDVTAPLAAGEPAAEAAAPASPTPEIVASSAPPAPAEGPAPTVAATKAMLGPLEYIPQTLNNCGPASIAEVLAFWGVNRSQAEVQSVLRGDGNPYGMTPAGVPAYVASLGMDAVLGTGGTRDTIKTLLRAGFPVIVNQTVSDTDLEFHYRPIEGFDDAGGTFIASDPLIGPQYPIGYAQFEQVWAYTGHRFMVLYPPDKTDQVNAALAAANWDPAYAEGGAQAQAWSAPGEGGPPPITIPMFGGKPALAGWSSGPVTVGFKAIDQSGFGVANTSYAIDKEPVQLYRGEFTVKDPGKHIVTFHSVNFSGSREGDKTVTVDIDGTAPVTAGAIDGAKDAAGAYKSPAALVLSASDDVSGVEKTTYSLDGAPAKPYTQPVPLPAGAHVVIYSSVDLAGNQEAPKSLLATVTGRAGAAAGPAPAGAASAGAPPPGPPPGGYSICYLYDPTRPLKAPAAPGAPFMIRLQLCDTAGKNLSAASVVPAYQNMIGPPTQAKPPLPGPLRFDASSDSYSAEVPSSLATGTYALYFTASGDPTVHMITFRVGA